MHTIMHNSEKWELTHVGCLEPAYKEAYPDGRPSRSTAYTDLHPNGDPSGSLLKDGSWPTLTARSQPTTEPTPMVTRASQWSTHTLMTNMITQLRS